MSGKRPGKSVKGNPETKKTNTNPTPSQSPTPTPPLSQSPEQIPNLNSASQSPNGSESSNASVGSGPPSVSSQREVLRITGNMAGVQLDEKTKQHLRAQGIYPPDLDGEVIKMFPGGTRSVTRREIRREHLDRLMSMSSSGSSGDEAQPLPIRVRSELTGSNLPPPFEYTGNFIIPEIDESDRHRFWGACDNEVCLLLPPSALMENEGAGSKPLFCNLKVEEINSVIGRFRRQSREAAEAAENAVSAAAAEHMAANGGLGGLGTEQDMLAVPDPWDQGYDRWLQQQQHGYPASSDEEDDMYNGGEAQYIPYVSNSSSIDRDVELGQLSLEHRYSHYLASAYDLTDQSASESDVHTAALYIKLLRSCQNESIWANVCRQRRRIVQFAPILLFRDLEYLCRPENHGTTLQAFLDENRNMWLDRQIQIDNSRTALGSRNIHQEYRYDLSATPGMLAGIDVFLEKNLNDVVSDAGTDTENREKQKTRQKQAEEQRQQEEQRRREAEQRQAEQRPAEQQDRIDSGDGSLSPRGGKRRKPSTKRKARRSASSKRKPTSAAKRRRTATTKSKRTRRTRVRQATRRN